MILLCAIIVFIIAYRYYGAFIARRMKIDPSRRTPAHTMNDGVDYYPAPKPVLFGHHFASIAGAPDCRPCYCCVIRLADGSGVDRCGCNIHGRRSRFYGPYGVRAPQRPIMVGGYWVLHWSRRQLLFPLFLWTAVVLIVAVYLTIVAKTFEEVPVAATSSMLFIPLAVFFGFAVYRARLPVGVTTVAGVLLLAGCVLGGWYWPVEFSASTWIIILLVYIFIASVTPVWILLQPRDYLNSFLLYASLLLRSSASLLRGRK
jgi:carbon starvation protein